MPSAPRPTPVPRPLAEAARVVGASVPAGADGVTISGVTHDSRAVVPGDLYAALPGFVTHGAEFAADAARLGAAAILTDPTGADRCAAARLPVLVVASPRSRLGTLAAWVYGDPARDLLLLGVTGTNGKTTTTYLLAAGLAAAGHRTGLIGTTGTLIGDERIPTVRTTPEATDVHALLAVMRERGVTAVAMEVSSHALALGRVDGLRFDVAGFTNLSQDHLDFHGSMEEYFAAKASLFTAERAVRAVVGVDDPWGARLAAATTVPRQTFSAAGEPADYRVVSVADGENAGQHVRLECADGTVELDVRLPGRFNVANAVAAYAMLRAAGIDAGAAVAGIGSVDVPGRMEPVDRGQPFVAVVDYAHSPDAVSRALSAARGFTRGRVIAVLGCGGDRDRDKRPLMGEVAARLADVVVVTDDNPRGEPPAAIRASMIAGVERVPPDLRADVREIGDRRAAIAAAVGLATPGDAVLVLGKGHEQGQEVDGTVHPFDDRVVLGEAIDDARGRS